MPDTRSRVLAAAAAEFAERGFAGAGVDRIARRARLTKGMIYYHFRSKTALYREVLQATIRERRRPRRRASRESDVAPADKVRAFVATLLAEVGRQPHFPRILLREIAEQGRHLDADTMTRVQALPRAFREIRRTARRRRPSGRIRSCLYISLISPILFYLASRTRARDDGGARAQGVGRRHARRRSPRISNGWRRCCSTRVQSPWPA